MLFSRKEKTSEGTLESEDNSLKKGTARAEEGFSDQCQLRSCDIAP